VFEDELLEASFEDDGLDSLEILDIDIHGGEKVFQIVYHSHLEGNSCVRAQPVLELMGKANRKR
jgi:hypothetical protein